MKFIPLSGKYGLGKVAKIDDEDYEFYSQVSWQLNNFGYAKHSSKGKSYLMHRSLMKAPRGKVVDHINGDKLDNQKSNLRICTQSQNRQNSRKQLGLYSKYKGVRYSHNWPQAPWHVRIKGNSKTEAYIGQFTNELHAALCYDLWAKDLYGDFAKTNFKSI